MEKKGKIGTVLIVVGVCAEVAVFVVVGGKGEVAVAAPVGIAAVVAVLIADTVQGKTRHRLLQFGELFKERPGEVIRSSVMQRVPGVAPIGIGFVDRELTVTRIK